MYNKKSKASGILTIVTAVLIVGLIILLYFLPNSTDLEGWDAAIVVFVSMIYGFIPLYGGGTSYITVALIFGSKMLKKKIRKRLIYYNVSMLITTIVLFPIMALGVAIYWELISHSTLGVVPIIYLAVTALTYIASLIVQITTIVSLKKSPEEPAPTITEQF